MEHLPTWGTLHAGDVVQRDDDVQEAWAVAQVTRTDGLCIVLVKDGQRVVGYPAPDAPVVVLGRSDTSAEYAAFCALSDVFGSVEVLGEIWS